MTRTSNLHPFAYHCTLPDGEVFTIKSATRYYTHNVASLRDGTWKVHSSHSTEQLAKREAAKVSRNEHYPAQEVRVVPMDNQRPEPQEDTRGIVECQNQVDTRASRAGDWPVHTPEAEVVLPEPRTQRCEHERKAKKGLGTCAKGCAPVQSQVVDLAAGCTQAVDQAIEGTREAIKASWMESQGVAELLAEGDRKAEAARETLARAEAERPQRATGATKQLREGHRVSWFLVGEDGTWEPYKGQPGCPTRAIRCSCGQEAGPASNGTLRKVAKAHRAGHELGLPVAVGQD